MIEQTIVPLALQAHEKGVEFLYEIEPTLPEVFRGDVDRLRQVVVNLLSNAVKFTEVGEVSLHIALENETPEAWILRFAVRDTGIGIPPEKTSRLFEKFSQMDASTSRRFGGTGLGLAIAKEIVTLMHGQIGVESTPGQGSHFWFTVTLAKSNLPAGQLRPVTPRPAWGNLKILVVSANPTSAALLQRIMENWGAQVRIATQADPALQALRDAAGQAAPFQVVVIDHALAGMDGLVLARQIAREGAIPPPYLVLLVPLHHRRSPEEYRAAGIHAWLKKPVRPRELRLQLESLLDASTQASAPLNPLATEPSAPPVPSTPATAPAPQKSLAASEAVSIAFDETDPPRVLLVEDNSTNRAVATAMLRKLHIDCLAVEDGQAALEALGREDFSLVFMDIQMPVLDGLATTRRIRAAAHQPPAQREVRNPHIYILAMTAHAMSDDAERCLAAGMNDYMSKPINLEKLRAALQRWRAWQQSLPSSSDQAEHATA